MRNYQLTIFAIEKFFRVHISLDSFNYSFYSSYYYSLLRYIQIINSTYYYLYRHTYDHSHNRKLFKIKQTTYSYIYVAHVCSTIEDLQQERYSTIFYNFQVMTWNIRKRKFYIVWCTFHANPITNERFIANFVKLLQIWKISQK